MMGSLALRRQADRLIAARHDAAEQDAGRRFDQICRQLPRVAEIHQQLGQTGSELARAVLSGQAASENLNRLQQRNQSLHEELETLLKTKGFVPADLDPRYSCPVCEDTGSFDGKFCACKQALLKQLAYDRLNQEAPLALCDFDRFTLEVYPTEKDEEGDNPRAQMRKILEICKAYAHNFSPRSGSLLIYGRTGLGKTHLSLAIAKAAVDKGYGVVYGPTQTFFDKLQKEHFSRENEDADTEQLLLTADLLILDDLGAEFITGFTVPMLCHIINTRLLASRPTIISTNLSVAQLYEKYSERVASRIIGGYQLLRFAGKDVRQIKAGGQKS